MTRAESESRAKYLREKAAEFCALAKRAPDSDYERRFSEIADMYDAMAQQAVDEPPTS
jgi:hypothetical protein